MKALKRRVISIFMAVVLVLSMLPFMSVLTFAEGETPFTLDSGEVVALAKDAYDFDDGYGTSFTADLYTVAVPMGTTEINITFEEERLAYGYDSNGYYVCGCSTEEDGNYLDFMAGEKAAKVKVDESGNFPEYIHVQTPYVVEEDNWISDTLYVIKIVPTFSFTASIEGEKLTDISYTDKGYTGYGGVVVPVYIVNIPRGTDEVLIQLSDAGLLYNYNSSGEYISGNYKDEDLFTGITEKLIKVDDADYNGVKDGAFDYIQVQKPYIAPDYSGGDLLYAITFTSDETPAPSAVDNSDISYEYGYEWEVLAKARGGDLTEENAKAYFESVIKTVTEKGSAKLNDYQPNENAKVILALTAAGYDATNVAGYNLLEPLFDVDYAKGTYSSIAVYSLLALDAHPDYESEQAQLVKEALAEYLYSELGEEGVVSYEWGGETYVSLDSTAMILQALQPYYSDSDEIISKAITALANGQMTSGGFNPDGSEDGIESTCTTAQIIIAFTEYGINPDSDLRFVQSDGSSPITYLNSCKTTDGFCEVANGTTNLLATQQGNLAAVAFQRLVNGDTSLFDMSDIDLSTKPIQASKDGVLIVEFENGIDRNYTLTWEEIEVPEELANDPNNVIKLYSINVMDVSGNPVEIKDNMKVRLKVGNDLKQFDSYKTVYVKDGKIAETLDAALDGEEWTFEPKHLSDYGIAGENNVPLTGDNFHMTLWIILATLSIMAAAGAVTLARHKN
ncbi:MAG: hypothetical protein IKZ95_04450 [Lachnospiraceae bacterium]|nr:hypothetical protein [Lachnospiraceae bacterium]